MKNNKYHSDFILQYKLGLLPDHILRQIPAATKSYWKHQDYNNYFAADVLYAQEKNMKMVKEFLSDRKLLAAGKAMYHVFLTLQHIHGSCNSYKKQIRQHKELVVKTIEKQKHFLGLKRSLRLFGISRHQFYAWKKQDNCPVSVFGQCYKRFPNQLTQKEVITIKNYLTNPIYKGWSNASIYYQMVRDRSAGISISSFYRYAHRLNLTKPRIKKPKYATGIRAEAPRKLLHLDVTIFRLSNHTKVYISVLMDNYSRYILNIKASLTYSPEVTVSNLHQAFSIHTKKYKDLLCDGGIENKGEVDHILKEHAIKKIIAQKDIVFSNSMVEAVNKRIKYDFLYWHHFPDFGSLERFLPKLVDQYNDKPHTSLYGFTPKEVFDGLIPSKDNFSKFIAHTHTKRPDINRQQTCDPGVKNCEYQEKGSIPYF